MSRRPSSTKSESGSKNRDGVVTGSTKAISAMGVVAAFALVILVNILSARHYERWDFTSSKLYTLSQATISTLQSLEQNIRVEVLLSPSDPIHRSVKNMLDVYGAKTHRLETIFVDPDRYPAEFVAVQQKYNIAAGRTEDGRVVTDAALVIASGDRHWFIRAEDMVSFDDVDDGVTKSKLEQALTEGIRAVLGGERKKICFTHGHGEYSLDDRSGQGLGELRQRLEKNNFDTQTVNVTQKESVKAYDECDAVVVASPSIPFPASEADAIAERMKSGMGALFMLNPMLDGETKEQLDTGLESVTQLFGIGIAKDLVFELDDDSRVSRGTGEVFFPSLQAHSITEGLMGVSLAVTGMRVVTIRTRSFDVVAGDVQPVTFLKTSDRAFGMTDFFSWAEEGGEPRKGPKDRSGPLSIGMAAELPKKEGMDRGARLVVLGSTNLALGQNWRDLALRGNAVLTGNIMSWIASKPPIVDVPAKMTPAATLRITEGSLKEVARYVLLFMPGAALLMGIAVMLRRRAKEDRNPKKTKSTDKADAS